jgi:hypothetical protein
MFLILDRFICNIGLVFNLEKLVITQCTFWKISNSSKYAEHKNKMLNYRLRICKRKFIESFPELHQKSLQFLRHKLSLRFEK